MDEDWSGFIAQVAGSRGYKTTDKKDVYKTNDDQFTVLFPVREDAEGNVTIDEIHVDENSKSTNPETGKIEVKGGLVQQYNFKRK